MVNDRINVVGTNIAEKAIMIWNVADMLRDPFKPHEYGLVILPMIHFNPRSPCGERHHKTGVAKDDRKFQSTLPVWGATPTFAPVHFDVQISIHAPRVGSDGAAGSHVLRATEISIHAPRVGSDFLAGLSLIIVVHFNPRSPCGERLPLE